MARITYESTELTIINDQCESLPGCPVCGYVTNLDEIVVKRTAAAGGGRWVTYVLRCLNSVDPPGSAQDREPGQAAVHLRGADEPAPVRRSTCLLRRKSTA